MLAEILSELRGAIVRVTCPQRGDKTRLVEIAGNAAKSRFAVDHGEEERIQRALDGIAEIAQLAGPPVRIECYDNSNLLGMDPVASQVVFLDGRPSRKDYRRYKVKTVVGADDYATMEEILRRSRSVSVSVQNDRIALALQAPIFIANIASLHLVHPFCLPTNQ